MKLKSLFTVAILSSFLTACGGDDVKIDDVETNDPTILDLNIYSIKLNDIWEDVSFRKWLEEEGLKIEEINALKQLEEYCYQNHSKKAICRRSLQDIIENHL